MCASLPLLIPCFLCTLYFSSPHHQPTLPPLCPSSIFTSFTLSHKWTVKIPSEYRSGRASLSNGQEICRHLVNTASSVLREIDGRPSSYTSRSALVRAPSSMSCYGCCCCFEVSLRAVSHFGGKHSFPFLIFLLKCCCVSWASFSFVSSFSFFHCLKSKCIFSSSTKSSCCRDWGSHTTSVHCGRYEYKEHFKYTSGLHFPKRRQQASICIRCILWVNCYIPNDWPYAMFCSICVSVF